jgi:hypothetical protein
MKTKNIFLVALLVAASFSSGCIWHRHKVKTTPPVSKAIVTPDDSLAAKVVSVNTVGRFVVLAFPAGQMPKLQQTLFLYRAGLKVGEVRITGPQSENNIVADLVAGEAKSGDVVRDQ